MAQDYPKTKKEIERLLSDGSCHKLPLNGRKYVLISDMHLGNGSYSDDFVHNESICLDCLEHYRQNLFTLLLLGDTEDFWQVKPEEAITRYKNTVYKKIREFGSSNVIRIYGNHDIEWGSEKRRDPCYCEDGLSDECAFEAVKFTDREGRTVFLVMHGHQGSVESQLYASISRPFVWLYGKLLEPAFRKWGWLDFSSEPNTKLDSNYEQVLYKVAAEKKVILICGHSHNAIFESRCFADRLKKEIGELQLKLKNKQGDEGDIRRVEQLNEQLRSEEAQNRVIAMSFPGKDPLPCYFNTGCCLYTDGLTCIELEEGKLRLIKWTKNGRRQFDEGLIDTYIREVLN